MKIQYKFLLTFMLLLGIFIFNNSNCYALVNEEVISKGHTVAQYNLDDYYDSYLLISSSSSLSIIIFNHSDIIPCIYFNPNYSETIDYSIIFLETDTSCSIKRIWSPINDKNVSTNTESFIFKTYDINFDSPYYLYSLGSKALPIYSTSTVYYTNTNNVGTYESSQLTENIYLEGDYSFDVDKLNLFELNLTDLDYNNQVHKFNLATYTNSPCYDELMEYYNKDYQYIIYLTDYERILTYQNYDDDNSFLYGSYVISGYIDYLITDKAFFYYSQYYNQVLSYSGNTVFNKNKEDYTKRFYFKLTYSEDSNDPHAEIWSDNGNLYKIDYLESFEDRYFVGSSQTIYYANENSKGNYKDLTKDIYYLGYLNPTGGKTRDISTIPFYVYNFDYAGGSTELYVVNQNDYNYEEMIKSRYDNWENHYNDWTILTDSSTGGSYAQGNDLTSSTFTKGDVTDDTTTENDQSHIGEIRTPFGDTDVIDKQKQTEEGIKDGTLITDTGNKIKDKFSFSNNIINNANEIKDYIVNTQETHKYYLNINHKYLNGQVCIIDLSWYEAYKPTVDAFICAFAYLAFIWRMFCIIPNLISGASASSYINDIQAYKETGFWRSSIRKGGF